MQLKQKAGFVKSAAPRCVNTRRAVCVPFAAVLLFMLAAAFPVRANQPAVVDSLLFTIPLVDDSSSIFFANWTDELRNSLAGPVFMANQTLLFHSKNGYALYNMHGKLLEEHSLIKDNARAIAAGRPPTYLAYPIDAETIIYYTDHPNNDSVQVFRKKLNKKGGLDRIPAAEMELYRDMFRGIKTSEPRNIFRSGTTEDVGRKVFLQPHLAGFTSLSGGSRWWSLDMFFSFTSPMIMETEGRFTSFFPGLRDKESGGNCDVPIKLIEPIGVFQREGRWYYVGIHTVTGTKEDEYFQTVVLCDQAGNVLYCSQMLKQEISDAILHTRMEIMTHFTVRRPGKHVFIPAVDAFGDIFYGIIAWEWKKFEVYKRSFERFLQSPVAPAFGDAFDRESRRSFLPIKIDCSAASRRGIVPEVLYKDDQGKMELLDTEGLSKDNFFVMVHRLPDEDLKRKSSRVVPTMPQAIGAIQDSISKLQTIWCPYGISLNHAGQGALSNLDYGFGDIVVCSWVLGMSKARNVYVRVDLEDWAEVLVFTENGQFIERFTFNNQHYKDRRDVVVLSGTGADEIYERDYEAGFNVKKKQAAGHRFVVWKKGTLPILSSVKEAPGAGKKQPKKKK
ncbi:MAG: hypothetical protein FWC23_01070 [Chitinispirillia bacterium]|nr:hypothetical protein [Chitinispirillia bacterium]MCL2267768.1 hypothetical protein [Chitinispirillia bacterium]